VLLHLLETPALFAGNIITTAHKYSLLGDKITGTIDNSLNKYKNLGNYNAPPAKNSITVYELALTGITAGAALNILQADIQNRRQCLTVLAEYIRLQDNAEAVTNKIERSMATLNIEQQYFSQKDTIAELRNLRAFMTRYLLGSLFSLSIERKIVLAGREAPWR
jgi:hypothetical protein